MDGYAYYIILHKERKHIMRNEIRKKVISLIREVIDDDKMDIQEDTNLVRELELSSLELANLLATLENEYHVEISDFLLRRMITVGNVIDVAMERIGEAK